MELKEIGERRRNEILKLDGRGEGWTGEVGGTGEISIDMRGGKITGTRHRFEEQW